MYCSTYTYKLINLISMVLFFFIDNILVMLLILFAHRNKIFYNLTIWVDLGFSRDTHFFSCPGLLSLSLLHWVRRSLPLLLHLRKLVKETLNIFVHQLENLDKSKSINEEIDEIHILNGDWLTTSTCLLGREYCACNIKPLSHTLKDRRMCWYIFINCFLYNSILL